MRFAVILSALLLGAPASAQELSLSSGTMQLGGNATFTVDSFTAAEGIDAQSGFEVDVRPRFGYFILDGLEILVAGGITKAFGDRNEGAPMFLGIEGGAAYFFALGGFAPYVGANLGFTFAIPDGEGDTLKFFNLSFPAGVLIALNDWVAIDAGLRVNYTASMEEGGGSILSVPMGYLGVQCFFGGGGGSSSGDDW